MKRSVLMILLVAVTFFVPQEAVAGCQKCQSKLNCLVDECWIEMICAEASFGQPNKIGCEIVDGACQMGGDFCLWAFFPLSDEVVIAHDAKEPS